MNFIMMIVFYSTLFLSPIMIISSSNVVVMWLGLELSTFSFLPMIFSSAQSSFSTAKYFFIQSVASVMILVSFFYSYFSLSLNLMFFAFMLKLGMAPFHFWLPKLVSSLQIKEILILLVWQKIGPLFAITFIPAVSPTIKIMVGLFSVFVGSISGLKQTQWKQIFTFSSISHLGWLIISGSVSIWLVIAYFFIYAVSFIQLMISNYTQFLNTSVLSFSNLSLVNLLMLLSLAGLPPMLGFLAKLMVLFYLSVSSMMMLISLTLIFLSILSMYFYLKIFFSLTLSFNGFELMRNKMFILSNMILFLAFPLLLNF